MQWSDISFQPSSRTLRQFAGLWIVFFGGLACWLWLGRDRSLLAALLGLAAIGVGGAGLLAPQTVRWIYVGWMVLAFPIGWTVSRLILGVIFYGLFTPIAFVFRLVGRDALGLRRQPAAETYWVSKTTSSDVRRYFQQF